MSLYASFEVLTSYCKYIKLVMLVSLLLTLPMYTNVTMNKYDFMIFYVNIDSKAASFFKIHSVCFLLFTRHLYYNGSVLSIYFTASGFSSTENISPCYFFRQD